MSSCPRSYTGVNGEYEGIKAELDAAQGEFKEFERKDIKFRWAQEGVRGGRCLRDFRARRMMLRGCSCVLLVLAPLLTPLRTAPPRVNAGRT